MSEPTEAVVLRVSDAGEGDRVCADLATVLASNEGVLVGSFARALYLATAEADETEYAPARPFRVNAGACHHYVRTPGNRTAYLSELASGSRVLVVSNAGLVRTETVGRVKLERRPLVLVEAQTDDGEVCTVLMQNAPTARLMTPSGPRAAAELRPGERVLIWRSTDTARHVGVPVDSSCIER